MWTGIAGLEIVLAGAVDFPNAMNGQRRNHDMSETKGRTLPLVLDS